MRQCLDCHRVSSSPICNECIDEMCSEMNSVDQRQDQEASLKFRQDIFCVLFGLIVIGVMILSQF